jgi:hypothetical protein
LGHIDKNYGGVDLGLSVRIVPGRAPRHRYPPRTGARALLENPFVIAYEDFWHMIKDAFGAGSVG